ncbi:MAG: hypothetical protein ACREPQ_14400 [Rhodanobacter sp.]
MPAKRTFDSKLPIWHKDNFGFWLAVCCGLSLMFTAIYPVPRGAAPITRQVTGLRPTTRAVASVRRPTRVTVVPDD